MKNKLQFKAVLHEIRLKSSLPDVIKLKDFKPDNPLNFEVDIEVFVGIEGHGEASERFDISICTLSWIENSLEKNSCVVGHGKLIVNKFSAEEITNQIESYLKMCIGSNLVDVMRRVGLLGEWEYEWEI